MAARDVKKSRSIRFTDGEWECVERRSAKAGMTPREWVHGLVMRVLNDDAPLSCRDERRHMMMTEISLRLVTALLPEADRVSLFRQVEDEALAKYFPGVGWSDETEPGPESGGGPGENVRAGAPAAGPEGDGKEDAAE